MSDKAVCRQVPGFGQVCQKVSCGMEVFSCGFICYFVCKITTVIRQSGKQHSLCLCYINLLAIFFIAKHCIDHIIWLALEILHLDPVLLSSTFFNVGTCSALDATSLQSPNNSLMFMFLGGLLKKTFLGKNLLFISDWMVLNVVWYIQP